MLSPVFHFKERNENRSISETSSKSASKQAYFKVKKDCLKLETSFSSLIYFDTVDVWMATFDNRAVYNLREHTLCKCYLHVIIAQSLPMDVSANSF